MPVLIDHHYLSPGQEKSTLLNHFLPDSMLASLAHQVCCLECFCKSHPVHATLTFGYSRSPGSCLEAQISNVSLTLVLTICKFMAAKSFMLYNIFEMTHFFSIGEHISCSPEVGDWVHKKTVLFIKGKHEESSWGWICSVS